MPIWWASACAKSDLMRRLNQFGSSLAATVRKTDIVTRQVSVFWVLTPECNADMVGFRLCEIRSDAPPQPVRKLARRYGSKDRHRHAPGLGILGSDPGMQCRYGGLPPVRNQI